MKLCRCVCDEVRQLNSHKRTRLKNLLDWSSACMVMAAVAVRSISARRRVAGMAGAFAADGYGG
jgi:hypothetical protein